MADMDNDGKKTMLENAPRPTVTDALKGDPAPTAPVEKKVPPGCVERVLNFRDRNTLIGAGRDFCRKPEHKKLKDLEKLDRLSKVLCLEETIEYFFKIQDWIDEEVLKWKGLREKYRLWRQYKENLLTPEDAEEFRKRYPGLDLEKGPEKPSYRQPEIPPKKNRGPERSFYIPAKIDVWAQDVLRATDWDTPIAQAEFVVELCAKFDIKDDGSSS